jgi:hypothetical protein
MVGVIWQFVYSIDSCGRAVLSSKALLTHEVTMGLGGTDQLSPAFLEPKETVLFLWLNGTLFLWVC